MKVGLLPGWRGPLIGSATASLSLMPFSIPLLIFSGGTVVSPKRPCRHRAKPVKQEVADKGLGKRLKQKRGDPALSPAGRENSTRGGEGRGQHAVHSPRSDPSVHQARALQRQIPEKGVLGRGESKGMEGNPEGPAVVWREEGAMWAIKALPGCGFCSEVASGRTQAGGQGVLAPLGKWSEGSGSGPAFPLKVMALEFYQVTSVQPRKPSVLRAPSSSPAHLLELSQEPDG